MTEKYHFVNYRTILTSQIRFAALMSIFAMVMGLFYREFSRPFFEGIALEDRFLYSHFMELVHGHTFLLGAAIPLGMALMTYLVKDHLAEKDFRSMRVRFIAYIFSSSAALLLMIYKGVSFIMGAGQPLDVIDASLFFGNPLLRGIMFGLSHVVLFWALGEYMFRVFRAAKGKPVKAKA